MIGFARVIAFRRVRVKSEPVHQSSSMENDLVCAFQNMHIRELPKVICPAYGYIQKRHFHASPILHKRLSKDQDHLDEKGSIKAEILQARKTFLTKHGMLKDKIVYLSRIVYANTHLYDVNQVDCRGRSNLERMQDGLCPVDKTGTDILCIHHFDQTMLGPWVILPNLFHQQQSPHLHSEVSLSHGVIKRLFALERIEYWKYQACLTLEDKRKCRP